MPHCTLLSVKSFTNAGIDAETDAGTDTGTDAGTDAGTAGQSLRPLVECFDFKTDLTWTQHKGVDEPHVVQEPQVEDRCVNHNDPHVRPPCLYIRPPVRPLI